MLKKMVSIFFLNDNKCADNHGGVFIYLRPNGSLSLPTCDWRQLHSGTFISSGATRILMVK